MYPSPRNFLLISPFFVSTVPRTQLSPGGCLIRNEFRRSTEIRADIWLLSLGHPQIYYAIPPNRQLGLQQYSPEDRCQFGPITDKEGLILGLHQKQHLLLHAPIMVQSVHVLDPPFPSAFWKHALGHLQDLWSIKRSHNYIPGLTSTLLFTPSPPHDRTENNGGHVDEVQIRSLHRHWRSTSDFRQFRKARR